MKIGKELKKNLLNKEWRVNNLYKIVDKQSQAIKFKWNPAQADFNKNKHTRNIILKSRQLGFTTEECINSLDDTLWNRNFKSLFISYDKDSAIEIFDDKIKYAWDNYPKELRKGYTLDSDRANKLKFDFGNETYSSVIVRTKGRSGTFQRVHISEFGKICRESPSKAREIITGTIPTVPSNGRIDIESTAEGEEGNFHDMFWEAWNRGEPRNNEEFKAHFYNWQWEKGEIEATEVIPIEEMEESKRFIAYRERLKTQDGIELTDKELTFYYKKWLSLNKRWSDLQQEFPTTPEEAFVSSGNKLFNLEDVNRQKQFIKDPIEQKEHLKIYEDYRLGHTYCLGADVSHGKGKDSSTIVVLDLYYRSPKVVAVYRCNTIEADTFAYTIKDIAVRYGSCLAGVENNDRGYTTLVTLKGIYNNIYRRTVQNKKTDQVTKELGFNTNVSTKPKMMLELNTALKEDCIEIPDKGIITELRTYNENNMVEIKFNEDSTKHWDTVIGLGIAYQMRTKAQNTRREARQYVPSNLR